MRLYQSLLPNILTKEILSSKFVKWLDPWTNRKELKINRKWFALVIKLDKTIDKTIKICIILLLIGYRADRLDGK